MSETMKKYLRKRCEKFQYKVDKSLLWDPSMPILPLSYHETMRRYFPHLEAKQYDFIKKWDQIYEKEGYEGLAKERRGRANIMDGVRRGRPPKIKPEIKDDLKAENKRLKKRLEYLEAENEYLKKLQALIQQKEAQKTERKKK